MMQKPVSQTRSMDLLTGVYETATENPKAPVPLKAAFVVWEVSDIWS
jgi:hypothetical protein